MNEIVLASAVSLAESIYSSPEAVSYRYSKEKAYADATTASMLERYEELRQIADGELYTTGKLSHNTDQELTALVNSLQFNSFASEFLLAEYNYTIMLDCVYSIIGRESGFKFPIRSNMLTQDKDE